MGESPIDTIALTLGDPISEATIESGKSVVVGNRASIPLAQETSFSLY
jgi:hypothetical protein